MSKPERILLYENPNLLNILLTAHLLIKAERVYILKPGFPYERELNEGRITKIIRPLNKKAAIETLSYDFYREYIWEVNKKSVDVTVQKVQMNSELKAYKHWFERIVKLQITDSSWERYFRMVLNESIRNKLLFYESAIRLTEKEKQNLILIPRNCDKFNIIHDFDEFKVLSNLVPKSTEFVLGVVDYFRKILITIGGLSGVLIFVKRGLKLRDPVPIDKKIGLQMVGGINKTMIRDGKKLGYDDRFLLDEGDFSVNNFLFIKSRWGFTKTEEIEIKKFTSENGAGFIDESKLKPTISSFIKVMVQYILFLTFTMRYWGWKGDYSEPLYILWHHLVHHEISVKYAKMEVVICWDDYSPKHIIRTWVYNKYRMKTVGMQHSAQGGTYLLPQLAFVWFDKYLIYGKKFKEMFSPYWDDINTVIVGIWRTDYIYQASHDERLQVYFNKQFKNRFIVFTSVSLSSDKNDFNLLYNFYQALNEIVKIDKRIIVVINPRRIKDIIPYKPLINENLETGRIIMDPLKFNTYEWTSHANVVIGADASSHTFETICSGKIAFAFNFDNVPNPLENYSNRLVVTSTDKMMDNIRDIFNEDKIMPAEKLTQIRNDFSVDYDGRCIERIKNSILDR